jgi:NAD(P)H-dependent FMN reductase
MNVKILFFAGSLRKDSYNKKLAKAAHDYAQSKGAEVTFADLKDYPMPFMDEDLEKESGMPENAAKFKTLMASHDAFVIASPEYNGSISGVLKNTLDWVSRPGGKGEDPFSKKIVALLGASPGALGGVRGLPHLRQILGGGSSLKCLVIPDQMILPYANKAFDDNGKLTDEKQVQMLQAVVDRVIEVASKK